MQVPSAVGVKLGIGVTAAVLASVLVAIGITNSDGVSADEVVLGDGAVWLAASETGEVVRVDGLTGRVSGRVGGFGDGDLVVAQRGADALVVNQAAEAAYRVDGAREELAGVGADGATGVTFDGIDRVVTDGDAAYVVAPGRQSVQAVDPMTLATIGEPVSFVGAAFDATVDRSGRLFLLDLEDGVLQTVEADESTGLVDLGWTDADAGVVLSGEVPVVVNRDEGTVSVVQGDAAVPLAEDCAWFRDGEAAQFAGSARRDWFSLVVPSTGSLLVTRVDTGACPSPAVIADEDSDFGAPVEAEDRIFVPVLSSGQVVVVEATSGDVVSEVEVVDEPGTPFELVVENEIVYFNAPGSYEAGVIRADGQVTRADKFSEGPGDPPELGCAVGPRAVTVGQSVRFEAKHREGEDIDELDVEWMFGDGEEGEGNPATHSFDEPGTYTATGRAGSTSLPCPEVVVSEGSPDDVNVRIQGPKQVLVGAAATYRDVSTGAVESRRWDIPAGDPSKGTAKSITVTFAETGDATVSLTIVTRDGETQRRFVTVEVVDELDPGNGPDEPNEPNEPDTSSPTSIPPTEPGCTAPTVQISGPTAGSVGQSLEWSMALSANGCDLGSPHWTLTGPEPTATSANQTFTRSIGTAGTYTLSASVDYTTAAGNPATSAPVTQQVTITDPLANSPWNGTWYGGEPGAWFDTPGSFDPATLELTQISDSQLAVTVILPVGSSPGGPHMASVIAANTARLELQDADMWGEKIDLDIELTLNGDRLDTVWSIGGSNPWADCLAFPMRHNSGNRGTFTYDGDCDGTPNGLDNCEDNGEGNQNPLLSNPSQADTDGDGIGDKCDLWDGSWTGMYSEGTSLGTIELSITTEPLADGSHQLQVTFTDTDLAGGAFDGSTFPADVQSRTSDVQARGVVNWANAVANGQVSYVLTRPSPPPPGCIDCVPTLSSHWKEVTNGGPNQGIRCFFQSFTAFGTPGSRTDDPGCTGPAG